MQEKLKACGLQAINNIVDITNFVMLETGQPLHAFDLDKISNVNSKFKIQNSKLQVKSQKLKTIIVRRAKSGEQIKTLDDKMYTLDESVLVIADEMKPIAIAGIKGGFETGIDKNTKNVVIEAANFNPVLIRRASQKLKLRTDASWRFENSISPQIIDSAQARVAFLIQQIAKGSPIAGMVDVYPKKPLAKILKLNFDSVESLLGIKIPDKEVIRILESLGFKIKKSDTKSLTVEIPFIRLDIEMEEDLIEEVGRIFGYENIPSALPKASLTPPVVNEGILWLKKCRLALKEAGFCEAYNSSFIGEKDKKVFGYEDNQLLLLENPMSVLNKYLRPSLIPNLLKNIKDNFRFFDEIKLFEFGHIFNHLDGQRASEKKMLSGVLTRRNGKEELFFELKGAVEALTQSLGIDDLWFDNVGATSEDAPLSIFHPGKTAEIKSRNEEVGFLGEIHPRISEEMGISGTIFVFDLDFQKLVKFATLEREYLPIPSYPAVLRDLAVAVPEGTKMFEIETIISAVGGDLVEDVDLFDTYSGEELGEGRENLAFHVVYQAKDRNLSSEEVNKVHQRIVEELEKNPGWEVRR